MWTEEQVAIAADVLRAGVPRQVLEQLVGVSATASAGDIVDLLRQAQAEREAAPWLRRPQRVEDVDLDAFRAQVVAAWGELEEVTSAAALLVAAAPSDLASAGDMVVQARRLLCRVLEIIDTRAEREGGGHVA